MEGPNYLNNLNRAGLDSLDGLGGRESPNYQSYQNQLNYLNYLHREGLDSLDGLRDRAEGPNYLNQLKYLNYLNWEGLDSLDSLGKTHARETPGGLCPFCRNLPLNDFIGGSSSKQECVDCCALDVTAAQNKRLINSRLAACKRKASQLARWTASCPDFDNQARWLLRRHQSLLTVHQCRSEAMLVCRSHAG